MAYLAGGILHSFVGCAIAKKNQKKKKQRQSGTLNTLRKHKLCNKSFLKPCSANTYHACILLILIDGLN